MRVLSLGWGTQSFTLAAMSALGQIRPFDVIIHADTGFERKETYEFIGKWGGWLLEKGANLVTVGEKDNDPIVGKAVLIPAYTLKSGKRGMIRRQCTRDWKVKPIRRYLQANREGQRIELCIGISLDEFRRMKQSDVQYIVNNYPLIDLRLTRADCVRWLQAEGLGIPPKSSCVFCPYHDKEAWLELLKSENGNKTQAMEVDQRIRNMRPPFALFIHPHCKPIEQVKYKVKEKQLSLWDNECTGMCGV